MGSISRGEHLRLRFRVALQAVASGWAVLLAFFLLEYFLFRWTAPALGPAWFPPAIYALQVCALAGAGRLCGRKSHATKDGPASGAMRLFGLGCFVLTLLWRDFNPFLPVNFPWLLRLVSDASRDSRYVQALVSTALMHVVLFGIVFAAGLSGRPPQPSPISGL